MGRNALKEALLISNCHHIGEGYSFKPNSSLGFLESLYVAITQTNSCTYTKTGGSTYTSTDLASSDPEDPTDGSTKQYPIDNAFKH